MTPSVKFQQVEEQMFLKYYKTIAEELIKEDRLSGKHL
jgi:hypothetical protein